MHVRTVNLSELEARRAPEPDEPRQIPKYYPTIYRLWLNSASDRDNRTAVDRAERQYHGGYYE